MAHYKKCRNCGNDEDGDWIYQCNKCNRFFCDSCRDRGFYQNTECPHCGTHIVDTISQIDNPKKEEQSEDQDTNDTDDDYSSYSSNNSSNTSSSDSIFTFPLIFFGFGFALSVLIGFFKGCGLFHFDPNQGNAYLFDIHDAGEGFWIFPIIGTCIGVIVTIISSRKK